MTSFSSSSSFQFSDLLTFKFSLSLILRSAFQHLFNLKFNSSLIKYFTSQFLSSKENSTIFLLVPFFFNTTTYFPIPHFVNSNIYFPILLFFNTTSFFLVPISLNSTTFSLVPHFFNSARNSLRRILPEFVFGIDFLNSTPPLSLLCGATCSKRELGQG